MADKIVKVTWFSSKFEKMGVDICFKCEGLYLVAEYIVVSIHSVNITNTMLRRGYSKIDKDLLYYIIHQALSRDLNFKGMIKIANKDMVRASKVAKHLLALDKIMHNYE